METRQTQAGREDSDQWYRREIEPHARAVERYALRLARGQVADAQDLTQETLLRAFEYRPTYRSEGSMVAWLCAILRRLFINRYRISRRIQAVALLVSHPDESRCEIHPLVQSSFPSPEDLAFKRFAREAIGTAILRLPESYRTVLLLAAEEGLPYQQIAERLRLPVGTVRTRLNRGRARLRRHLALGGYPKVTSRDIGT